MGQKTSATSLFRHPIGARAATAFLSGSGATDGVVSHKPPVAHTTQHEDPEPSAHRYRTIWLSDIHLGSSGCQAPYLLDFLRHNDSEYLYLVGDIIDGWQLKKGWYWPQAHNDVVQKILRKARKARRSSTSPATTTKARGSSAISRSATSRCAARHFTRRSQANVCGSCTATCSTA